MAELPKNLVMASSNEFDPMESYENEQEGTNFKFKKSASKTQQFNFKNSSAGEISGPGEHFNNNKNISKLIADPSIEFQKILTDEDDISKMNPQSNSNINSPRNYNE